MKEIKIFIGSSVDKNEFELEREKLGSFINGLNRKYIKQGIFIDLYDCETVSNQMRAEGSQKQHDDYIENEADATFFMFFKKAGEFTLHELQIARDALVNQNRPDIFTYFKVVGDDIEETDQIKKAVDIIANSYGHYFSKFTDVDTIKLGMLQYIADKLNDGSSVTIYDGEFYISNTKVEGIELDNIFAYQNNGEYKKLKEKLATIKPELHNFDLTIFYRNIANYYRTQNDNEKALSFYIKAMNIQETFLNKNKKCLYNNTDNIFEDNDYYQLFPLGKREELGNVYPEIKVVDLFISYNEIGNIYEHLENIKRAEYYYKKAIRISEVLSKLNQPKYGFDLANNYFNIGLFYNHQNDLILTEYYYNKAINIINQLDKCNSLLMHKSRLAEIYNCFGTFYAKQSNIEKAEHYYLRAISINEQLVIENPERYNANLADNYNNISSLYDDFGNIEQTKYYYRKSIKIYVQLAKYNPERYNGALAINFYRYGNISNESKYFNKALKLAKMQPDNPYCRQIISALEK